MSLASDRRTVEKWHDRLFDDSVTCEIPSGESVLRCLPDLIENPGRERRLILRQETTMDVVADGRHRNQRSFAWKLASHSCAIAE